MNTAVASPLPFCQLKVIAEPLSRIRLIDAWTVGGGGHVQTPLLQDLREQSLFTPQAIPRLQLGAHAGMQTPFGQSVDEQSLSTLHVVPKPQLGEHAGMPDQAKVIVER
jgi:hypothetical protein